MLAILHGFVNRSTIRQCAVNIDAKEDTVSGWYKGIREAIQAAVLTEACVRQKQERKNTDANYP